MGRPKKESPSGVAVDLPADLTDIPLRNMRSGFCSDPTATHGHDHCDPVLLNPGGSDKILRCPCECHEWLWTAAPSSRLNASATIRTLMGYDDPPGTQRALDLAS